MSKKESEISNKEKRGTNPNKKKQSALPENRMEGALICKPGTLS